MKKNNKKGFTIVELVIVIAVIAILAAVLIPTFTGVTEKAQKSAALQNAENAWKGFQGEYADKMDDPAEFNGAIQSGDYYIVVTDGQLEKEGDDIKVVEGTYPGISGKTSYSFNNCKIYLTKDLKISAALQNAKNAWTNYITTNIGEKDKSFCIKSEVDGTVYYFHVESGEFETKAVADHDSSCTYEQQNQATVVNGKLVLPVTP
ncbi:MAG: type II secretion system GspH family protein [Clostridiales bacterium]|nr:type II secretion system GspH family protein [Clostridiales bacterium]